MARTSLPRPSFRMPSLWRCHSDLLGSARPAAAATVSWAVDADGDWNNPANWSGAAVPTLSDDVVIDRPSGTTRSPFRRARMAAHSIHSNERLVLDAGSLTVAETLQVNSDLVLDGATLIGAIVSPGANGEGMDALDGTLNGVTMNADLNMSGSAYRTIGVTNGLTLNGTALMGDEGGYYGRFNFSGAAQTLDGTGEIVLGGASQQQRLRHRERTHGGVGAHDPRRAGHPRQRRRPLVHARAGDGGGVGAGDPARRRFAGGRGPAACDGGGTMLLSGTWSSSDSLIADGGGTLQLTGRLGERRRHPHDRRHGGPRRQFTTAASRRVRALRRHGADHGTLDNTGHALTLDAEHGDVGAVGRDDRGRAAWSRGSRARSCATAGTRRWTA